MSEPETGDPPPFLGTWKRVYLAVLGCLGLQVVLMYLFRIAFS